MKGATNIGLFVVIMCSCFNSRSREGSDLVFVVVDKLLSVSTHAPVKGATGRFEFDTMHAVVSTHAPVKGATIKEFLHLAFSPVSTHAPVKGATRL